MSENVEILIPEVDERVVEEEDARLYDVTAVLALIDSPYHSFEGTQVQLANPVPVQDDTGLVIGSGFVYFEGARLLADLTIDYHTPMRLDIELAERPVFAHLIGTVWYEQKIKQGADELGRLNLYGRKRNIDLIIINGIALSYSKPEDWRVQRVGEVVL